MNTLLTQRRILWTALLVLLAIASSTALARPITPTRERSDNTMTFTYDAASGEITEAASSRTLTRADRLQFFAYVEDAPNAEIGRRLKGIIELRRLGDRAVKLDGTLSFVVQDDSGTIIETFEREIDIVLRDREGKRFRGFRWRFDLPTGNYTAFGTFEA